MKQYKNLKELNVCDNQFTELPRDLSGMHRLANLNLNGNQFTDVRCLDVTFIKFNATVTSLRSLPSLRSVYLNLYQEDQVDFIMRTLEHLDFLNGLKVERDILYDEEGEEEEEDDHTSSEQSSPEVINKGAAAGEQFHQ